MSQVSEAVTVNQAEYPQEHRFRLYLWVVSYLRPYAGQLTVIVLCGLIAAAGELVIPKMIEHLVDNIIPDKNKSAFTSMLLLLIGIVAFSVSASLLRNLLQRAVGSKAARDLQFSVLQKLRKLGFSYYEQRPVGETLSLMNNQVHAVQELYTSFFPDMLELALFVILAVSVMVSGSLKLTLVAVPFFLIYYAVGPSLDRKTTEWNERMNTQRMDYNRKIHESVSGIRDFRAFSAENWDLQRGLRLYQTVTDTTLKWVFFIHTRWSIRRVFFDAGAVALFIFGYWFIRNQTLTVGAFLSFFLIYSVVMFKLSMLIGNLAQQGMMLEQANPIRRLMLLKPLVEEPEHPIPMGTVNGRITFKDVGFHYPNRPPVIRDFSLDIRPGERLAFVGTSGNGKSTLLKLINRFYDPQEGTIELDGVPITRLSFQDLRGSIGYVFQESYLFGFSVRENIRFGRPEASDEEIEQAAKAAMAHEFILQLPQGYDTLVGDRGMKLSGGQKQRIAIARMLISDPRIVLLDEATSALDNVSEGEVKTALDRLFQGRTMIAVAHRLSTIKDFDRIVVVDEGTIAEIGSYEELIAREGIFYNLAQGQGQTVAITGDSEDTL
ncbi:ABC transporter ATP-binding protein [Paenibacillus sp. URB8-2]|uniref:ABC transporter ATP-binding protein n=1 Tax=Paenibacillus sp. URB8-2 TaxID=2741301 RepID=UPI0015C07AD0|nr:ABC transporter ATP-binding protein [Paenibacillus sp. URB8-2]BCG58777.1 ABC transporter ATP-binding protein [Paenibacillus sp. URB8-2]